MKLLSIIFTCLLLNAVEAHTAEISNEGLAIEAAERVGGWTVDRDSVVIDRVTFQDSTTPFVGAAMNGRRAWRVTWGPVSLPSVKTDSAYAESRVFDIEMFLDSATGGLFKAVVTLRSGLDSLLPLMLPAEAESMLIANEQYEAPPENPPVLSLKQALGHVIGPPVLSRQIVAYYVLYSGWKVDRRPAWVVERRGMPPLDIGRRAVPAIYRRYRRDVIDATTGENLMSGTHPRPKLPDSILKTPVPPLKIERIRDSRSSGDGH